MKTGRIDVTDGIKGLAICLGSRTNCYPIRWKCIRKNRNVRESKIGVSGESLERETKK